MTLPLSNTDLRILRTRLQRGDASQRAAAIVELATCGLPLTEDLASLAADQFRRGLRVASSDALALLQAWPQRDLYDAMLGAGVLAKPSPQERCRLLMLGIGDCEADLCEYLFRNWQQSNNVWIRHILSAFGEVGTSAAWETLAAIAPELEEYANTMYAARVLGGEGSTGSLADLGYILASRVADDRLEQLKATMAAVASRLGMGDVGVDNRPAV